MPSYQARMEYINAIQKRYHRATKHEKSEILKEFCRVCRYNRKYAIRLLNGPAPTKTVIRRRRPFRYGAVVIEAAEAIWKFAGFPCGPRLKETIRLWMPFARRRLLISPEVERQLLSISARQLDQRLRPKKRLFKRRFYSITRPGSLLKRLIPIRTWKGDIHSPGFLEIDLVAHCGSSLSGYFLYTLTATDLATGWTECRAVRSKGQGAVLDALKDIRSALPFPLRAIDSDNGEEFINYHLYNFCLASKIGFTRGRPYKKDDNAHVEQKNFTHVRRIFGWDRYESDEALEAINDLYRNELRLFQNLFQPSAKLKRRTRIGTRLVRTHDVPKTPFERVLASGPTKFYVLKALKEQRAALDPFELSTQIDRKLDRIFQLTSETSRRPPPPPQPTNFIPKDYGRIPFGSRQYRRATHMATAFRNAALLSLKKEESSVTS